ncbi:MAG: hypothetical protein ABL950_03375 [Nitrospira sp.]
MVVRSRRRTSTLGRKQTVGVGDDNQHPPGSLVVVHAPHQATWHQRRGTLLRQSFQRWSIIAVIVSGAVPSWWYN